MNVYKEIMEELLRDNKELHRQLFPLCYVSKNTSRIISGVLFLVFIYVVYFLVTGNNILLKVL